MPKSSPSKKHDRSNEKAEPKEIVSSQQSQVGEGSQSLRNDEISSVQVVERSSNVSRSLFAMRDSHRKKESLLSEDTVKEHQVHFHYQMFRGLVDSMSFMSNTDPEQKARLLTLVKAFLRNNEENEEEELQVQEDIRKATLAMGRLHNYRYRIAAYQTAKTVLEEQLMAEPFNLKQLNLAFRKEIRQAKLQCKLYALSQLAERKRFLWEGEIHEVDGGSVERAMRALEENREEVFTSSLYGEKFSLYYDKILKVKIAEEFNRFVSFASREEVEIALDDYQLSLDYAEKMHLEFDEHVTQHAMRVQEQENLRSLKAKVQEKNLAEVLEQSDLLPEYLYYHPVFTYLLSDKDLTGIFLHSPLSPAFYDSAGNTLLHYAFLTKQFHLVDYLTQEMPGLLRQRNFNRELPASQALNPKAAEVQMRLVAMIQDDGAREESGLIKALREIVKSQRERNERLRNKFYHKINLIENRDESIDRLGEILDETLRQFHDEELIRSIEEEIIPNITETTFRSSQLKRQLVNIVEDFHAGETGSSKHEALRLTAYGDSRVVPRIIMPTEPGQLQSYAREIHELNGQLIEARRELASRNRVIMARDQKIEALFCDNSNLSESLAAQKAELEAIKQARAAEAEVKAKAEAKAETVRTELKAELAAQKVASETRAAESEAAAKAREAEAKAAAKAREAEAKAEAQARETKITADAEAREAKITADAEAREAKITAESDRKIAKLEKLVMQLLAEKKQQDSSGSDNAEEEEKEEEDEAKTSEQDDAPKEKASADSANSEEAADSEDESSEKDAEEPMEEASDSSPRKAKARAKVGATTPSSASSPFFGAASRSSGGKAPTGGFKYEPGRFGRFQPKYGSFGKP